jgi:hypothetical protein
MKFSAGSQKAQLMWNIVKVMEWKRYYGDPRSVPQNCVSLSKCPILSPSQLPHWQYRDGERNGFMRYSTVKSIEQVDKWKICFTNCKELYKLQLFLFEFYWKHDCPPDI